jgi:lipopolysaccharide export system permease protein
VVRLPELLVVVLPVALLLALLYALSNHARHHELVAMRAAGVSFWRLGVPYLVLGLVFSLGLFYLNEQWVPDSTSRAEQVVNRHGQGALSPAEQRWQRPLNFRNDRDNRIWNIAAYNLSTHEMIRPQVEWREKDGTLCHIIAERAEREEGCWTFFNVTKLVYPLAAGSVPDKMTTNMLVMPDFIETPDLIRSEIKIANLNNVKAAKKPQLSIVEIRNYLRLHRQLAPEKAAMLLTQLHGRLAEPWTCLVVVFIALPFGATPGQRNVFVGVAASIFICFSYFILQKFGLALGTGGYLPSWFAAWLPNLAFTVLALWVSFRVQ